MLFEDTKRSVSVDRYREFQAQLRPLYSFKCSLEVRTLTRRNSASNINTCQHKCEYIMRQYCTSKPISRCNSTCTGERREEKGEKSTGSTPQRFEHEVTRYDTPYLSSSSRRSSVQSLAFEHIDIVQSAGIGVV